jgi:nicotinamide riboside transporter PnuC
MNALNATGGSIGMNAITGTGPLVLLTGIMFLILIVTLFMFVKYFRRFIYGLCFVMPLTIIGWISWSVVAPMREGNSQPVLITSFVVGLIMITCVIGVIAERYGFDKLIERILKNI